MDQEKREIESYSEDKPSSMDTLVAMHGDLLNGVAGVVQAMRAPKRRILERGPDGRAIGVVEVPDA